MTGNTYDAIGNPTRGWDNGRNLVSASGGGKSITYGYNLSGIRTSKTVGGVTHNYLYASGKLLRETYGSNTLDFFYDADGKPYALKYNGTVYYYITNLQGDVIQLVNASDTVVATYDYDPYGKLISSSGTMAEINPLRYRGYYYDSETGFYYLQSRYYDPAICRFINADAYASTGQGIIGHNMFAYCGNNPVNRADSFGEEWYHWAIGAAIVVGFGILTVATCGGSLAAAVTAVNLVSYGFAASSTATTIAAAAFVGSSITYGTAALTAAYSASSVHEFNSQGSWGTVAATGIGGLVAAAGAYGSMKSTPATDTHPTHTSGVGSPQKNPNPNGSYTQFDSKGNIYSYAQYDSEGRQTMRIDFQGRSHAGILPHIHLFTYPELGGKAEYIFDLNWKLIN